MGDKIKESGEEKGTGKTETGFNFVGGGRAAKRDERCIGQTTKIHGGSREQPRNGWKGKARGLPGGGGKRRWMTKSSGCKLRDQGFKKGPNRKLVAETCGGEAVSFTLK